MLPTTYHIMSIKSRFPVHVRGIALVLLFAMFHYVAGYRLLYSLGILYTKDEAKTSMVEKSNAKKITFSAKDYNSLKWTEEKKEFSFQNQMYDVVNVQKTGDIYTITAFADDPETELINAFHNFESELFHSDQSNNNAKSAENIMSSFQKEFTTALSEFKINMYATIKPFQNKVVIQHLPLQIANIIWHPPTAC